MVGTFVGLSGVGAGVLTAPALILLGIHPTIAVGTDLAFSAVTKVAGTVRNASRHLICRPWFLWMILGSVPGTALGTEITGLCGGDTQHLVRVALAAVLIVASTAIVAKELLAARGAFAGTGDLARTRPLGIVAVAFAVGALVGLTSIGSGSLFMIFILAFSAMSPRQAVATDIANAAALTVVAGALHLAGGSVNLTLAANLAAGSVPGILLGGALGQRVPVRPLRFGIAVLVLAGGLKMML